MTYGQFLLIFLVLPLVILAWRMRRHLGFRQTRFLALLSLVALVYTTPWDNYLVATGVWYYNPDLVAGITLGWVPLEEYLFFVLQPLLVGLGVFYLSRRWPSFQIATTGPAWLRLFAVFAGGLVWLGAVAILIAGWPPGTYLGLELVWALPPILLQLAFGADILWQHRRWVMLALLSAVAYFSVADALAISSGTWAINPAASLNVFIGGILPIEELVFFILTNTLIVFSVVLTSVSASRVRAASWIESGTSRISGGRLSKWGIE